MQPESSPENDRHSQPALAQAAKPTRIGNTAAASDACPDCSDRLYCAGGCFFCPSCGWSACE